MKKKNLKFFSGYGLGRSKEWFCWAEFSIIVTLHLGNHITLEHRDRYKVVLHQHLQRVATTPKKAQQKLLHIECINNHTPSTPTTTPMYKLHHFPQTLH